MTTSLPEHVRPQADRRPEARAERGVGIEQRLRSVVDDDVDQVEDRAEDGEEDRLIDEKGGEGDVADGGGGEDHEIGDPAERARGRPGIGLRRRGGALRDVLGGETPKRMGRDERDQRRAKRAAGDGDIERGADVGGGLDEPFGGPDRREDHPVAKEQPRRPVADRRHPPGRLARAKAWRGRTHCRAAGDARRRAKRRKRPGPAYRSDRRRRARPTRPRARRAAGPQGRTGSRPPGSRGEVGSASPHRVRER